MSFSAPSRNTLVIYPPQQKKNFIFVYEYEKTHVNFRVEKLEKDMVTRKTKIQKQKTKTKRKEKVKKKIEKNLKQKKTECKNKNQNR